MQSLLAAHKGGRSRECARAGQTRVEQHAKNNEGLESHIHSAGLRFHTFHESNEGKRPVSNCISSAYNTSTSPSILPMNSITVTRWFLQSILPTSDLFSCATDGSLPHSIASTNSGGSILYQDFLFGQPNDQQPLVSSSNPDLLPYLHYTSPPILI
jgi:hypothetical protein